MKVRVDGPDLLALLGLLLIGVAVWVLADWAGLTAYMGMLCVVGSVAWGQRNNGRTD